MPINFSQQQQLKSSRIYPKGPFPCPACDKVFRYKVQLENHGLQTHPQEKLFSCDQCPLKKFRTAQGLLAHRCRTHNKPAQLLNCPWCPLSFRSILGFRLHFRSHTGEGFYCDHCPRVFLTNNLLESHILQAHIKDEDKRPRLNCPECKKTFNNKYILMRHQKWSHKEDQVPCPICHKLLGPRPDSLTRHMKMVHSPNEMKHSCEWCGDNMRFINTSCLETHIQKVHTKERPYCCPSCTKSFSTLSNLNVHKKKVVHSMVDDRKFTCPDPSCSKTFRQNHNLQVHVRTSISCNLVDPEGNLRKKGHKCPLCSKTVARLRDHLSTHTRERDNTECPICRRSFFTRAGMKHHITVSHTRERPHSCPTCRKQFRTNVELKKHMETHTRNKIHECPVCQKRLRSAIILDIHLKKMHQGPRYKCLLCPKLFINKSRLTQHAVKHAGKRPFKWCESCPNPKGFLTQEDLESHNRRVHKI